MKNDKGEKWWDELLEMDMMKEYGQVIGIEPIKLKPFIENILQSQKSKLEQEILEKMPREKKIIDITSYSQGEEDGFNSAISQVKAVINAVFKK